LKGREGTSYSVHAAGLRKPTAGFENKQKGESSKTYRTALKSPLYWLREKEKKKKKKVSGRVFVSQTCTLILHMGSILLIP
jgi:hypothetical protein